MVSAGLGPSQSIQLAWEPTSLRRGSFHNSEPGRATIVRRRFYSRRESSSRAQVVRHTLEEGEEGSYVPFGLGICGPLSRLEVAKLFLNPRNLGIPWHSVCFLAVCFCAFSPWSLNQFPNSFSSSRDILTYWEANFA